MYNIIILTIKLHSFQLYLWQINSSLRKYLRQCLAQFRIFFNDKYYTTDLQFFSANFFSDIFPDICADKISNW